MQCYSRHTLTIDTKATQQSYATPRLKSSLLKLYGRRHELIDSCEIYIDFSNGNGYFAFYVDFYYHRQDFTGINCVCKMGSHPIVFC